MYYEIYDLATSHAMRSCRSKARQPEMRTRCLPKYPTLHEAANAITDYDKKGSWVIRPVDSRLPKPSMDE